MKTYEEVIAIYKNLVGDNCSTEKAIAEIDKTITIKGMWNAALSVGAIDEDRTCTAFSIAHMTAYNKTFGCCKY